VGNFHPTPRVSTKQGFAEYPLRHSMDLVELGARSMDSVDLEFLKPGCLAGKKWNGAVLLNLELLGALPNTPIRWQIDLELLAGKRAAAAPPSLTPRRWRVAAPPPVFPSPSCSAWPSHTGGVARMRPAVYTPRCTWRLRARQRFNCLVRNSWWGVSTTSCLQRR
jgi:hypothetical protein